jgi:hypothetical protein
MLAGDDRPQGQKSAKDDKQKGKSSNSAAAESFAESQVVVAEAMKKKVELHEKQLAILEQQQRWEMFSGPGKDEEEEDMLVEARALLRKKAFEDMKRDMK